MWIPALLGGVLWKRGTKEGAITGLLVGLVWLIVGSFFYKPLLLGFHPIFVPLLVNAYSLCRCEPVDIPCIKGDTA